jgi:hypothetical protein
MYEYLQKYESKILAIVERNRKSWQDIAINMLLVCNRNIFLTDYSNFSQWIKDLSAKSGITESNYWKYLKVAKYCLRSEGIDTGVTDYRKLQVIKKYNQSAYTLYYLDNISKKVAPAAAREFSTRVKKNNITKKEISEIWAERIQSRVSRE